MDRDLAAAPTLRLRRYRVDVDGHRVGVAVAGHGVPLVVVHGYGVESLLYAQSLARVAGLGFRVVAIDVAGHGATATLGLLPSFDDFTSLVDRTIKTLGIERAVLAGHSMGGRLVAEVAANNPGLPIALVLLDAILGEQWEQWRRVMRWVPPALLGYSAAFMIDVAGTVPIRRDFPQAMKLGARVRGSARNFVTRPLNALATGQAVLWATSATPQLDRLRAAGVPAVVIHGTKDLLVPMSAARDTAERLDARLISIPGGSHAWMLRDPAKLPSVIATLLDTTLGAAIARALVDRSSLETCEAQCVDRDLFERALGLVRDHAKSTMTGA